MLKLISPISAPSLLSKTKWHWSPPTHSGSCTTNCDHGWNWPPGGSHRPARRCPHSPPWGQGTPFWMGKAEVKPRSFMANKHVGTTLLGSSACWTLAGADLNHISNVICIKRGPDTVYRNLFVDQMIDLNKAYIHKWPSCSALIFKLDHLNPPVAPGAHFVMRQQEAHRADHIPGPQSVYRDESETSRKPNFMEVGIQQ